MTVLFILAYIALAPALLWRSYLAVMALKGAKRKNVLTREARLLGFVVLAFGYFHDFVVNVVHMSLLLMELPRELTVTARINRHTVEGASGHKHNVCLYIRTRLLDGIDPDGIHT